MEISPFLERKLARRLPRSTSTVMVISTGPTSNGFNHARISAARRALLVKRAGEVATAWPLLAASFGASWPSRFITWADARRPLGSLRDGWDFARALADAGELPEPAATELAEREAGWRYDGHSAPRRRRLPAVYQAASRAWALIQR